MNGAEHKAQRKALRARGSWRGGPSRAERALNAEENQGDRSRSPGGEEATVRPRARPAFAGRKRSVRQRLTEGHSPSGRFC